MEFFWAPAASNLRAAAEAAAGGGVAQLHGKDTAEQAFREVDANKDGRITWDEWMHELFHEEAQEPVYIDGNPPPPRPSSPPAPRPPCPARPRPVHPETDEQIGGGGGGGGGGVVRVACVFWKLTSRVYAGG